MIEKWASPEALANHSRGVNLATLNPRLAGKLSGAPEVIVLQQVPAGDPAKGAL
jgi:quinol monooxygenase YgiN